MGVHRVKSCISRGEVFLDDCSDARGPACDLLLLMIYSPSHMHELVDADGAMCILFWYAVVIDFGSVSQCH